MAVNSGISWTDNTFNPWRGCTKVSPACTNCYADRLSNRNPGTLGVWGDKGTRVVASESMWKQPLKWNKTAIAVCERCGHESHCEESVKGNPFELGYDFECSSCEHPVYNLRRQRVFCASLSDVFENWNGPIVNSRGKQLFFSPGTGGWIDSDYQYMRPELTMNDVRRRLFDLIDATPNLDWQLLTKRPENILKMWPDKKCDYIPEAGMNRPSHRSNVWLGTSVENSNYLSRIDSLKSAGELASILFLSCEPLLGSVTTMGEHLDGIDWVIAGGESGPGAREPNTMWFRSLRDQCHSLKIPFHFKQWGEWLPDTQNPNMESSSLPYDCTFAIRVGTKKAGRLLDGVLHNEFPEINKNAN